MQVNGSAGTSTSTNDASDIASELVLSCVAGAALGG
jgi:hypothetical protein